ncbi:MAG: lipopolysaccharide heptosyltransferase II [Candidatus Omnitrophica bacterium]|nr:lipopolysaccharide heptosyltransferase II [Candidatus Omnitrophota bacterium]
MKQLATFWQMASLHLPPSTFHPRRILVIRLDRIGDVVLSTPVLQALRHQYPHAFIAMMVRPACNDVVQGNPYLNDVMLYEKEGRHRGAWATIRFALRLRQAQFDTAIVLHPTNRSHWIAWLAGIPVRIGYRRKCGWLLTRRMPHRKHEGERHEAVYTLELLRLLGITPPEPHPVVPIHAASASRVEALLRSAGIAETDALIAVHPSASCPSKRWMPQRFAEVADRLAADHGVRICLIAGSEDAAQAALVEQVLQSPALNFAGQLSLAELAVLLRRCRLLISNDSGPVHVAAAVGTPVVDIFGRNQRGLSPRRWGPLGEGHVILHKEVGCVTCLAHNCDIEFLCLTSLTVDEVYQAAVSILSREAPKKVH